MRKRRILVLDQKESPWMSFLSECFEDSSSQLIFSHDPSKISEAMMDGNIVDMIFIQQDHLSLGLAQKIKILKQSHPEFLIFHLGKLAKNQHAIPFDDTFVEPMNLSNFHKQFVQHLPLPAKIKILLIDDEKEVLIMMRDYLENRTHPSFDIQHCENGLIGLKSLENEEFHVVVLDVKMPVMNGREVYREIKARGIKTPVIIFFDAIFGDEMVEIHQFGQPAVVEKGAHASAMPDMAALIKKIVYFG